MHTFNARPGRWPLALTLLSLASLAACADEPVAPKSSSNIARATASMEHEELQVTVTNASGGSEVGSLQWAVSQVNEPGPATGVITFDASLEGDTITLDVPLQAQRPMEIIGPAKGITLSGNDQHRVITSGTSLTLRNLTLTKGYADYGSAVVAPSLSLYNTTVQDNRGAGSALAVQNFLRIVNSTVSRNVVGKPAVEYGLSTARRSRSTPKLSPGVVPSSPVSMPSVAVYSAPDSGPKRTRPPAGPRKTAPPSHSVNAG